MIFLSFLIYPKTFLVPNFLVFLNVFLRVQFSLQLSLTLCWCPQAMYTNLCCQSTTFSKLRPCIHFMVVELAWFEVHNDLCWPRPKSCNPASTPTYPRSKIEMFRASKCHQRGGNRRNSMSCVDSWGFCGQTFRPARHTKLSKFSVRTGETDPPNRGLPEK